MPRTLALLLVALVGSTASARAAGAGAEPQSGVRRARVIVATDGRVRRPPGARHVRSLSGLGARVEVLEVADVESALRWARGTVGVLWAEPDLRVRAAALPDDPYAPEQWNLQPLGPANPGSANAIPAHDVTLGQGTVVAIVDTGVSTDGEDLDPARILPGRSFVTEVDPACAPPRGSADDNGHGTHIAGVIAQSTGNGRGVAGVAPAARILPVKALDCTGSGLVSDVSAAITYAADTRPTVLNLSLAGVTFSQALCAAVTRAATLTTVVAAAGNGARLSVAYPAACPGAISVGAVTRGGARAPYSNVGCGLDIAAPGGFAASGSPASDGILQERPVGRTGRTFGTNDSPLVYGFEQGTSQASAHVAGAAALLLSRRPDVDVRRVLRATARDLGPSGVDLLYGAGALDVAAAVRAPDEVAGLAGGQWLVGRDGSVFAAGTACFLGSAGGARLQQPIVAAAGTPSGDGYRLAAADGGIFAFGDAVFHGSAAGTRLNKQIVGMAATPRGHGYWLVAEDGGIFAFGDAGFFGSTGGKRLNQPIVGMAATPSGRGYWLVARDGGIFAFGDAGFSGSTGGTKLNQPIVGMAATPSGRGYWLAAADGGIFAFGDAGFHGSTGGVKLVSPVTAMAATPSGRGYWLLAGDGGTFTFGDAPFLGSAAGRATAPMIALAIAG